ncbi:DsbA family oxidoreductase [Parvularcula flava]|uniref:DsbA family oxidoreductase n=1 Tax=Aquisalinus luteolus TaxID=1566827 RepID=A0A8J3A2C0_9PROT|nr:DsbA family oxidoreductase [Aquisalinus luteolus]NHK26849.1 DsbA family oxidoreductase [Aquisalinus luteolus]GGH93598.1 polyketide biosynthesis protein [Aquisalinus luteolus]
MSDTSKPLLILDMVSDPVCPWCYVGKRSLDRALMALSFSNDLMVRYRPYQLAPDAPKEGRNRKEYLASKFSAEQLDQMNGALLEAARVAGLDLDPSLPEIAPNTLDAHRVIRWAHEDNLQREVVEALFDAYWKHGLDLGSHDVLATVAAEAGMEKADVLARLGSVEDVNDVKEEAQAFRAGGVNGVPTFIINEQAGFAGALPPDQLLETIRQVAAETEPPEFQDEG